MQSKETIAEATRPVWVVRHSVAVRVAHWINAAAFVYLVWSGVEILFAHPQLYWGHYGYYGYEPAFKFADYGIVHWGNSNWGRNAHFLAAWVFVINGGIYLLLNLLNRHFQRRMLPSARELAPRNLLADVVAHLRLRHPVGEGARDYNLLQKLTYLGVIFVLCPLMLLTGLTMSPAIVSAFPWLIDLFGGRQSARTLHFVGMTLLVLFLVVHLLMVLLAGPVNEIRSMITGRFRLSREKTE